MTTDLLEKKISFLNHFVERRSQVASNASTSAPHGSRIGVTGTSHLSIRRRGGLTSNGMSGAARSTQSSFLVPRDSFRTLKDFLRSNREEQNVTSMDKNNKQDSERGEGQHGMYTEFENENESSAAESDLLTRRTSDIPSLSLFRSPSYFHRRKSEARVAQSHLEHEATLPTLGERGVTHHEMTASIQHLSGVQQILDQCSAYKQECEELMAEITNLRALLHEKDQELHEAQANSTSLENRSDLLWKQVTEMEADLTALRADLATKTESLEQSQAATLMLRKERDRLWNRGEIMEQNIQIHTQNIETLKHVSMQLADEIAAHQKRFEAAERAYKVAELKLVSQYEASEQALIKSYEEKMIELHEQLTQSNVMRQRLTNQWAEHETLTQDQFRQELRMKEAELDTLRRQVEALLKRSTAQKNQTLNSGFTSETCSAMKKIPRDWKDETDAVFRHLHRGTPIFSLECVLSGDSSADEPTRIARQASTSMFSIPPHDVRTYKIRVQTDLDELAPCHPKDSKLPTAIPPPECCEHILGSSGAKDERLWAFRTKTGTMLRVHVELLPSTAFLSETT